MNDDLFHVMQGDCLELLKTLPAKSVDCVVTSPPYWNMRDYQIAGQMGMEPTMGEYIGKLVNVFREIRRVLVNTGNAWLNLGDGYSAGGRGSGDKQMTNVGSILGRKSTIGFAPKQLLGIPWRVAFALQDDGWILRQDIIWSKKNCMPESVKDRCTRSHEYIFTLAKQGKYYFDHAAIQEPALEASAERYLRGVSEHNKYANGINGQPAQPKNQPRPNRSDKQSGHGRRHAGFNDRWDNKEEQSGTRNKRSVWECNVSGYPGAHFATFPPKLIEPCILAGCPVGGLVLDPFSGTGTSGAVAVANGRRYLGMELNPDYIKMSYARIRNVNLPLFAK